MAGLIKIVPALEHRTLPPNVNSATPDPPDAVIVADKDLIQREADRRLAAWSG